MNTIPLAERLRPINFDTFIGQEHLIGSTSSLRKVLDSGLIPSMILWGPPGTGKTTLAKIITKQCNRPFYELSAINSGVKDVRNAIEKAGNSGFFGQGNAILFIDEIHRFSKSQQDSLLGAVEKGIITLIGATTENPSFEVNSALLSRCQVYILKSLSKKALETLIDLAITKDDLLSQRKMKIKENEELLKLSGGDARKLLNVLELCSNIIDPGTELTNKLVADIVKNNIVAYDKKGDNHYDIASALIKSIRGSDPNAAVYWLARMIDGGEDPKFIARRLIISASEDIGMANPTALVIANNCFQAIANIGMPEGRIILSQTTIYLATSPKSNSAYVAINSALEKVKETGHLSVPLHIRNAPTKLMKEIGYGKDYQYSHDATGNFSIQEYLPDGIENTMFYEPGKNKKEVDIRKKLKESWKNKYRY